MKEMWCCPSIYTMEEENHQVEAVIVENGKIIAVGNRSDWEHQVDIVHHLPNNAVMYPGFVDSHMHLLGLGEMLQKRSLSQVMTCEAFLTILQEEAKKLNPGEWLYADQWNEFQMDRLPTIDELDAIYSGPMLLRRVCRHVALTNHAGLASLNITETKRPFKTELIGVDASGKLNGLLYEDANDALFQKATETLTEQQLAQMMTLAIDELVAVGLTGAHTEDLGYFGHYTKPLSAYKNVVGTKRKFRTHLLRNHRVFEQMIRDDVKDNKPWYEFGAMKIFLDGSFGGETAYLRHSYRGSSSRGVQIHTDEQLAQLVALARKHHSAVAVHAIGDGALEQFLCALEKVEAVSMRDRYIHGSLCTKEQLERLSRLNVIVDAQPMFLLSDMPWVIEKIGEDRMQDLYAWKRYLQRGIVLGAGTDAPIEKINPFETIWAGVTRKTFDERAQYNEQECVSRYEMISMYTTGSAYTANQETYRGKIAVGFDADFTILNTDLFTCDERDILQTKALQTVVNGEIVYDVTK